MAAMCDLHIHSNCSDGTDTPGELIRIAEQAGLSAVALCDHNTVAGLDEFTASARGSSVEAVPGVEFSTDWEGHELHILGLFIRPEHYGRVGALVQQMLLEKKRSSEELLAKLRPHGIELRYEEIEQAFPGRNINRAVIAEMLKLRGCCGSVEEAFDRWLSLERGYYVPPERPQALEVIEFIKSIGAVAVLAHPFLNLDEGLLRSFLGQAKPRGLDAMEVYYSKFSPEQTALACRIAEEFELCPSGGSDYHGNNKSGIFMGSGRGDLKIPHKIVEDLKKCSLASTASCAAEPSV